MRVLGLTFLAVFVCLNLAPCLAGQDRGWQSGNLTKIRQEKRPAEDKAAALSVGVTTRFDVAYLGDGDPRHKLDIYYPDRQDKPSAVLVHFHGGGWAMGDKRQQSKAGMFYAARGILFVAPNYRLSPTARHPAHVEDCAAAVAWVVNQAAGLGGDASRIFLSGHSAGAHLAALLGTDQVYLQKYHILPQDIAGIIPVDSASFDLADDDGREEFIDQFVKDAFGEDKTILKEASPIYHVFDHGRYPEFLILNTTTRQTAVKGAKAFADKLRGVGGAVRFVPVERHTHQQMAAGMSDESDPVAKAVLGFILHRNKSAGREQLLNPAAAEAPLLSRGGRINMIHWIPLTIGAALLLYSPFYYLRDCRGKVSPSMGGEMSFGVYWGVGAVLFALGVLPMAGLSRWWSIVGYGVGMAVSIPLRRLISKRCCAPGKTGPTGFQRFVCETEKKRPGTHR